MTPSAFAYCAFERRWRYVGHPCVRGWRRATPDTHVERPGAEPSGVPAEQGAGALAGGSSGRGSPETERAMASATPGRTDFLPASRDGLDDAPSSPSRGAGIAPATERVIGRRGRPAAACTVAGRAAPPPVR